MENRLKLINAMMFLLSFCLIECKYPSNSDRVKKNRENDGWVKDTIGCLHLRTKELAQKLIDHNKLMHNTKEQFLLVFKAPNKVENSKDLQILEYYTDNMCEHGKAVPNSDICWVDFYFRADKLVEMHFACE